MSKSFIETLEESFEAAVQYHTEPDNDAVIIMMNFIFERAETLEEFISLRKLAVDLSQRLFNQESYREVTAAGAKPYCIRCEEEPAEKFACTLLASMMIFHNLGNGELQMELHQMTDGRTLPAIIINCVIFAELCEKEMPYLSTLRSGPAR